MLPNSKWFKWLKFKMIVEWLGESLIFNIALVNHLWTAAYE